MLPTLEDVAPKLSGAKVLHSMLQMDSTSCHLMRIAQN